MSGETRDVACEAEDGTRYIHPESETCEVCASEMSGEQDAGVRDAIIAMLQPELSRRALAPMIADRILAIVGAPAEEPAREPVAFNPHAHLPGEGRPDRREQAEMSEKKPRYKIRPKDLGSWLILKDLPALGESLAMELEYAEPGDVWEVEIVEMTDQEISDLPEHDGW